MQNIKPEDYGEFFRIESEVSYFTFEVFMSYYKHLNCIFIYKDKHAETHLPTKIMKNCQDNGLKLFSSNSSFNKFKKDFLEYITQGNLVVKKFSPFPKELTKKQFDELFNTIRLLWKHYSKTEFFYSNKSYETLRKKDQTLKKNLTELEKLKFKGRTLLNNYLYGDNSLVPQIIITLSKMFNIKKELANFLSYQDVCDLFNGKHIKESILKERKKCFVMAGINKRLIMFDFKESKSIAEIFNKHIQGTEKITGTIACKGKITGKTVVMPTIFKKLGKVLSKINKIMKKGDILIAHTTSPELTVLCEKASAIITDQGGLGSHAAIISRELNIPCIVGTQIATRVLKTGDTVEVDANKGIIRKIK